MFNQNKSYELTATQLRKFEGFENITEEEAREIIFQLKELSLISFGIFQTLSAKECLEINNSRSEKNEKKKDQTKGRATDKAEIILSDVKNIKHESK